MSLHESIRDWDKTPVKERFERLQKYQGIKADVPVKARIEYLYIYGYSYAEITSILEQEFEDIAIHPITYGAVSRYIEDNKEALDKRKMEFAEILTARNLSSMQEHYMLVQASEDKTVRSLATKADELVQKLNECDINETNDKGAPVGLYSYKMLLETLEQTHKFLAKLAGNDSMREIQFYKLKKEIDQKYRDLGGTASLLPPVLDSKTGAPVTGGPSFSVDRAVEI